MVATSTIRQLMDARARTDPDHIHCTYGGRAYTFGEVDTLANRAANWLLALGLSKGDGVALMLPSHPDHVILILALAKAGLIRMPINANLKGPSLDHAFDLFRPRVLIADIAYAAQLRPVLDRGRIDHIVWRGKEGGNDDLSTLYRHHEDGPPSIEPEPDDILAIHPSSGTTGAPKGVLKSDANLRAGPEAILELAEIRDGDVMHMWEPLYHGGGVGVVIASVLKPITLAMFGRFSASKFWDEVRTAEATHIHYLGSVVPVLLKQPTSSRDRSHAVRVAWGGGCPPDLWREFEERFGVSIREGYGLSELISFVTTNKEGRRGSVGKALPLYDIGVFGESGRLASGETGEMRVRAKVPGVQFRGYLRNEEASRACMDGDWLCTGDLVTCDEDGFFYFKGRKKDVIRRRGVNIAAWEVEQTIAEHPAIRECALIAVPSPVGEDDLKLFLCTKPGMAVDPLELIVWCEPRMPYFQIPRYVAFLDELPKTPSERVKKNELSRATDDCFDLEATGHVIDRGRVMDDAVRER